MILHAGRVILGYLLLLFIPGYAVSWALYPRRDQIRSIERIAYSCILSVATVILTVLVIDLLFGMDTTPLNIVLPLLAITLIATMFWVLQNLYGQSRLNVFISSLPERPVFQKLISGTRRTARFIIARIPQETEERESSRESCETTRTTIYPTRPEESQDLGEATYSRQDRLVSPDKDKKGDKGTGTATGETIRDEDLFED